MSEKIASTCPTNSGKSRIPKWLFANLSPTYWARDLVQQSVDLNDVRIAFSDGGEKPLAIR